LHSGYKVATGSELLQGPEGGVGGTIGETLEG